MIKRIVKLSFQPTLVPQFMDVFEASCLSIRAFPGCQHMELLQDTMYPNIMFTFSIWDSEEALEQYRHSDLFKSVWARTKILFNDKPQAWSVRVLG